MTIPESNLDHSLNELNHQGFRILNDVYSANQTSIIKEELQRYFAKSNETPFGKRRLLLDIPALIPLLFTNELVNLVKSIDRKAFLTKAIYFDKPEGANWYVTWHQDVPINVTTKVEMDGYAGWTQKQDVVSVRPPIEISKNIFTIRIHLDDTTAQNGALSVIPASHTKRLLSNEINDLVNSVESIPCEVRTGGVHLMKPLLLHSSSKSKQQTPRRVIHLEFASLALPSGLDWLERLDL